MTQPDQNQSPGNGPEEPRYDLPSILFISWFIGWIIALLLLPGDYFTGLFFLMGAIPLIGWFLVKPGRLGRFLQALLGTSGLDN